MKRLALLSCLVAMTLAVAACGDDDSGGTTVTSGGVVFGEGVIPEGIPEDFPIPPNSAIGTSLIDRINNRSEVAIQVGAAMDVTIRFYSVGLVNAGYVVDRSEGSGVSWTIEFSRGELVGSVLITPQGNFSQIAVSVNQT